VDLLLPQLLNALLYSLHDFIFNLLFHSQNKQAYSAPLTCLPAYLSCIYVADPLIFKRTLHLTCM
jgi:hypothetical protein